ncbi:HesB/YadR/YfhF family protein [Methylocaldum marinum]|uniref:HesB/YadR/YfhF family protein n=1 Tax=Methylocaldum marinum TaxID=1432792 RepID=A0A250L0P7_9GAMM|nr:iron-sulfur cluster assembly accessory protein [Methylocaldum marinum]BBA37346.1 HesB/YadR/YfhF family protein [Methylocaldum marinum]
MDLTITPTAEKFIRRMVRFGSAGEDAGFRLSVSPGGCSGLASEFSVESEPKPGDTVVVHNGLKLFLPEESRTLLQGVTIDFSETPTSSGFVFHNPNSTGCSTCSSSSSASAATVSISAIQVKSSH